MEQSTPSLAGWWEQQDLRWAASSAHLQLETVEEEEVEEKDDEEDDDEEERAVQLAGGKLLLRDKPKVNNE